MIERINHTSLIDTDSITKFTCGNHVLDNFFRNEAADLEGSNIGTTVCFYDDVERAIVGFYTISIKTLDVTGYHNYASYQEYFVSTFVNKFSLKSYPVLEVMRFGVAHELQNKNYGRTIMSSLYEDCLDLKFKYFLPINVIYLEALHEVTDFYKNIGFEFLGITDEEERLEKYPMVITLDKMTDIIWTN